MTHRLSALSRLYTRSWDATLWRALTGSFFNALPAQVEPRVLRDQRLNNRKKKGISISQFLSRPLMSSTSLPQPHADDFTMICKILKLFRLDGSHICFFKLNFLV